MKSLKKSFIEYCDLNKYENNEDQIKVIDLLIKYNSSSKSFLSHLFKKNKKLGFYLHGGVGVGKTMILNFFYNHIKVSKQKYHFNEFMINFHNFRHENKKKTNSITKFVKNLKKKYDLIFFDEFQISNIVDAMILGKLFDNIFKENIRIIITSNTKIDSLYKDGLQRDQFIPFIKIIKKNSIQKELKVKEDYRKSDLSNLERFFSLKNERNAFKVNRIFHNLIKKKKKTVKKIFVKGRSIKINKYYDSFIKFDFEELCGKNLGAEDYISIAKHSSFILIENVPIFTDENLDKKQRFVTLIDILYEKKIPLMITAFDVLENINSQTKLSDLFKRTISRLYELTSPKFKI